MIFPITSILVLVLGSLSLLVCACAALRFVTSGEALQHLAHLRYSLLRFCAAFRGKGIQDDVSRAVRRQLLLQKIDFVRRLFLIACLAFLPVTARILRNIWMQEDVTFSTPVQNLGHVAQHLVLALVSLFPGLVTTWSLDLLCSYIQLLTSLGLTPWTCNTETLMQQVARCLMTWVALCLARRTAGQPFFFLMGLINSLCIWGTVAVHGNNLMNWMLLVVTVQLVTVLVSHHLETIMEQNMAAQLCSQDAKAFQSAECALLRSCCDVVVELDAEGAISDHAEDLGSYLLRGASLNGVPLASLIVHEGEREQFVRRLLEHNDTEAKVAENMLVSMRDGNNNILRVELLWFHFFRLNQKLHLAGLKEFSDAPSGDSSVARFCFPEATLTEDSTESSSCSSQSDLALPVVEAVLDCTQPGFPIMELSLGFVTRVARLPVGAPILEHVAQAEALGRWLRKALLSAVQRESAPGDLVVKFKEGQVTARCRLILEGEMDLSCVRLRFTRLRHLNRVGWGRSRGRGQQQVVRRQSL